MTDYQQYNTTEARRYIDQSVAQDEMYGLNGCVGELLVALKALVWTIDLRYPRDHFTPLEHARRLLSKAEAPTGSDR